MYFEHINIRSVMASIDSTQSCMSDILLGPDTCARSCCCSSSWPLQEITRVGSHH